MSLLNPVFAHEAMHAFQKAQHDRIEAAVAGVKDLNGQTLNEGIAHALSPGLLHSEGENADNVELLGLTFDEVSAVERNNFDKMRKGLWFSGIGFKELW